MKFKEILAAAAIGLLSPNASADSGEALRSMQNSGNVYIGGRHSGERDLVDIANNSCAGDLWIYNSGKWYDIGISNNGELHYDNELVQRILNETSGDIYNYEVRNRQCYDNNTNSITLQPISLNSIMFHVYLSGLFGENGRRVNSRVVDSHGLWRYSVSSRLAENLAELNAEALATIEDMAYEASDWLLEIPRAILGLRLGKYEQQMQSAGVYVSYQQLR